MSPAYRYHLTAICTDEAGRWHRYMAGWYRTLPEALAAFGARQEEGYSTVTLTPVERNT